MMLGVSILKQKIPLSGKNPHLTLFFIRTNVTAISEGNKQVSATSKGESFSKELRAERVLSVLDSKSIVAH